MFPRLNPYGLTISLALLTAYALTAYRAGKRGLSSEFVWDSLPWVVSFGLVGARLYHVLNFLPFYLDNLILIPQVWRGGLGIYGGLVGGLLGFFVFVKLKAGSFSEFSIVNSKLSIVKYLNVAAPGIALGQAIGRVGNIFNGENLPYAGWEIVANLLIFGTILTYEFIYNKTQISNLKDQSQISKIKNEGRLFFLYLLSYSMARFLLEFFRTDSPWIVGPLTMAQWISLVVVTTIFAVGFVGQRSRD